MPIRSLARITVLTLLMTAVAATPAAADPDPPVGSFTYTPNMEPLGWSPRPNPASGVYNSDLAFWGDRAYQGTYDGFQIVDISNPEDPVKVNDYRECSGTSSSNQGDVIIWEDLLIRSWNSNAGTGSLCDGEAVASGFEGLHVFDVSDEADPDLIASVDIACGGSHTATGVPDPENGRLLVYNSASTGSCPGIEIIEIPLDDPASATLLRTEPSGRSCHDTAVILGDAMLAACAGGNGFTLWSLGGERGGTLEDPLQLHTQTLSGVSIGHAASFSWDGRTFIFGHEPGGGSGARCQATSATVDKTMFFFDTETFEEVGRWVLPRPQTSAENCTIHNFNVVPSDRRNILVSGNYQSGIAVVDFTDRTNPVEIAYADPAPLSPTQLGGDWSSYWYDGHIYESDITRGLITWRLNDSRVAGAQTLTRLNPQTQEFTMPPLTADLKLSMEGGPNPILVGDQVTYEISVSNEGPEVAEAATVGDALPAGLAFQDADASTGTCEHDGSATGGMVTCDLGALPVGGSATVSLTATGAAVGFAPNTATASSAFMDPSTSDATGTIGTIVNPFAASLDATYQRDGDTVAVSGAAAFPAITAPEPVGGTKTAFNAQTQPLGAAAGLDLTAGQVLPITGGLRFSWKVADLPATAPPETARYTWTMQVQGGGIYQLEAKRTNVASVNALEDPAGHAQGAGQPSFRLRGDCEASYEGLPVSECHALANLTGSFDTANDRVTIDWPYQTRNASGQVVAPDYAEGVTLVNSEFAGMSIAGTLAPAGTSSNTAVSTFINGWAPYYAGSRVQLAAGPAESNPAGLAYGPPLSLEDGAFAGAVGGASGPNDTVYARACDGGSCAYGVLRVG